jgi:hypothetical protein
MVTHGNGCGPVGIRDAILALPSLTVSHACQARRIGDFGLVGGGITNRYQPLNLGAHLPSETFTNLYHRGGGLTTELDI